MFHYVINYQHVSIANWCNLWRKDQNSQTDHRVHGLVKMQSMLVDRLYLIYN